jgi:dihydroorotate dehydrogenase electron transfer subunit
MKEIVGEIVENEKVAERIYLLKIRLPKDTFEILPGQFAMLLIEEGYDPFLRRPMSFYNVEDNFVYFLYQKVGRGTEILSQKKNSEKISMLLPLGNSFPSLNQGERVLIVGGGVGIAPLNFLVNFYKKNVIFYSYIGFSSYVEERIYKDLQECSYNFVISTEDGSIGNKGKILEFLPSLLDFDKIIACGPHPMVENLYHLVDQKDKLYISFEERMGCGVGICLSCFLKGRNRNFHVCKDGPIIVGSEVEFGG